MTLTLSERMDFFKRFKDKDIEKLIELSVRFKMNRNHAKAEITDLLIRIKRENIEGLKKIKMEFELNGKWMELDFVNTLLYKKSIEKSKRDKEGEQTKTTQSKNSNPILDNQLKSIPHEFVKQNRGEPLRRWFDNNYFDLLIWENSSGEIVGFQLCYDKYYNQHALTWKRQTGYSHNKVDDGEGRPGKYKASPLLGLDDFFDYEKIADKFKKYSKNIDVNVSTFVYNKIIEYPN